MTPTAGLDHQCNCAAQPVFVEAALTASLHRGGSSNAGVPEHLPTEIHIIVL